MKTWMALATFGLLFSPHSGLGQTAYALVGAATQRAFVVPFSPHSFGININGSLGNPLDGTVSEAQLYQQVAVVMHDLRAIGASTARWFVTDVSPQWHCSSDPEDQDTGEIDPGWFAVARALLEQADRDSVKVVVVLGDLAYGSMGFNGVSSSPPANRDEQLRRWGEHRSSRRLAGTDGYPIGAPACPAHAGYYGATEVKEIFATPALRARLAHRDVTMVRFLAQFSALGAVELFNEPDFKLTHTLQYWLAVRELEAAVRDASPRMISIPVISGTAWWDPEIVRLAAQTGVLAQEPFLTLHSYGDYTDDAAETTEVKLRNLIASIRQMAPGKPVTVAEIASSKPLRTLTENRRMVESLIKTYMDSHVGIWLWGNWFAGPDGSDYKWMFNDRSPAGASFRPFFFDAKKEDEYAGGKVITLFRQDDAAAATRIAVSQVPDTDPDPALRERFALTLGELRFVGFSRAGAFPRPFRGQSNLFALPPATFFIGDPGETPRWAEIMDENDGRMTLQVMTCMPASLKEHGVPTPLALLGLAVMRNRTDFAACALSQPLISGSI